MLTLGMFDGIHIGHQSIIRQLNTIAKEVDGESVLLTFTPHPRKVLQPDFQLQMLTTLQEKERILEAEGLQNLIFHPFTREFSQVSAKDFVAEFLVKKLGLHTLVIGYDHHFGKNRAGDFEQLSVWSKEFGFQLVRIEEVLEKEGNAVSSTKVRNALKEGDVSFVNRALGRPYHLGGVVVHGDKIGRTLGFPTANLQIEEGKLLPKDGVYVVKVLVGNSTHLGLLSIGFRETVSQTKEHRVEVNILDFEGDLYGQFLEVDVLGFIRNEKKFNSLEELIEAMNHDKEYARNNFSL